MSLTDANGDSFIEDLEARVVVHGGKHALLEDSDGGAYTGAIHVLQHLLKLNHMNHTPHFRHTHTKQKTHSYVP